MGKTKVCHLHFKTGTQQKMRPSCGLAVFSLDSWSASRGEWAGFIFRLYRKGVSLNFVSKGMWSGSGCCEGNWILSTLCVEKKYSSLISLLFIYIVVWIKLLIHNLLMPNLSKVITVYKQILYYINLHCERLILIREWQSFFTVFWFHSGKYDLFIYSNLFEQK